VAQLTTPNVTDASIGYVQSQTRTSTIISMTANSLSFRMMMFLPPGWASGLMDMGSGNLTA
jgi:hypothetical protein